MTMKFAGKSCLNWKEFHNFLSVVVEKECREKVNELQFKNMQN